jgi:hypothetical protein
MGKHNTRGLSVRHNATAFVPVYRTDSPQADEHISLRLPCLRCRQEDISSGNVLGHWVENACQARSKDFLLVSPFL